jgi:protein SCO1/2
VTRLRLLPIMLLVALVAACSPKTETSSGKADVGGPFQLVNQDGAPTNEAVLKGKWSAIFFGFTYCPDVCPTTLQTLAQAQEELGGKAKDLQIVFFSVDPERDTPAAVKAYLASEAFPKGVIGLTGTPEQVAAAAKAYRVYYAKNGEGEDYVVDHSTFTYLMNPKGEFAALIPHGLPPADVAARIRTAMREG